jgi:ABC-type molybdate transport system substrate-binding protein
MRRPFVVLEAAPGVSANSHGAKLLADFLLSPAGQAVLSAHGQA